jgi:FKBP-type peptidyl-prolyl cis-trans isomerase 2
MANFWLLESLTLRVGDNTRTFQASQGHFLRLTYEPLDQIVEKADRTIEKQRVGYRVRLEIAFLQYYGLQDADFLRLCQNADYVSIVASSPVDLAGKTLAFEKFEADEIFHSNAAKIKATATVRELVYNIPAI